MRIAIIIVVIYALLGIFILLVTESERLFFYTHVIPSTLCLAIALYMHIGLFFMNLANIVRNKQDEVFYLNRRRLKYKIFFVGLPSVLLSLYLGV
ncbi:hypothetical protein [Bacillus alkalicellulosilyticus]|uniref:hypothetical protein n=1 Tax=Alkalihalobacterium alkalicellulosilyticum TaxID=1912214 RepID=UPI0009968DE9|nr:hypothetical protein [Bacillus alkalicellulosilyticus]